MRVIKTQRGFEIIEHPANLPPLALNRLVQQALPTDADSMDGTPGETHLWIGPHYLNREQVAELVAHLTAWLKTGSLEAK